MPNLNRLRMAALLCAVTAACMAQAETLLVKGAWPSASDATTPLPENGMIADEVYENRYFGLKYALAPGWNQQVAGPPPSDSEIGRAHV